MKFDTPETVRVATARVACDGGGALGHPKVYLLIGEEGFVECPYCDRRFEFDKAASAEGGH